VKRCADGCSLGAFLMGEGPEGTTSVVVTLRCSVVPFILLLWVCCVCRGGSTANIVGSAVTSGVDGVTSYRVAVSFVPVPEARHYLTFTVTNGAGGSTLLYAQEGLVYTVTPPVPRPERFGHSEFVGFRT
jgi:hypothetical protein